MSKFKPTPQQIKLLTVFLEQEETLKITALCEKAGICEKTYYNWQNNDEYCNWFYGEVRKCYSRFAPRLIAKTISKALSEKGTTEDLKLALQVSETWTPTQKNVALTIEDFLNSQEKELE